MSVMIGQRAPEFNVTALLERDFVTISLKAYRGQWVVLFFYAMDFTFLCATELVAFNDAFERFDRADAVLLGGSTDSEHAHLGWVQQRAELAALRYPLFADRTKRMAMDYGVLVPEEGVALRGTFIIDPQGVLRWQSVYALQVGRNVEEVVRVLHALKTEAPCPCGWQEGEATL